MRQQARIGPQPPDGCNGATADLPVHCCIAIEIGPPTPRKNSQMGYLEKPMPNEIYVKGVGANCVG